jgi:hypothetical protein
LRRGIQQLIDEGCLQFDQTRPVKNDVSTVTIYFTPEEIYVPERLAPITIYFPESTELAAVNTESSAPVAIYSDSPQPTLVGPITITVPGPVPYEKDSAIPWHYGADIYCQGQKVNEEDIDIGSSAVDNVGGIGGFTRSGRLFAPSTLRTNDEAEAAAKAKGKQVSTEEVTTEEAPPKTAFEKEVDEFMRIIKKSDYKVVDQLNQTPSKISILSLLMCSEAHRAALLKVLNMAYVPPEITVNQLESVVSNVHTSHALGFTDYDLTSEGRNHNKALHITMECKGTVLSHVLVDTGSSLNVLPRKALTKLD